MFLLIRIDISGILITEGFPVHVDQVFTEYEYPEPIGYVNIKYDLFAEDKEQRTIIEVQHIREDDFFDRFLY